MTLDVRSLTLPIVQAPMAGGPAFLVVDSPVPGAEVLLDGHVVGRTPLGGSLPVARRVCPVNSANTAKLVNDFHSSTWALF